MGMRARSCAMLRFAWKKTGIRNLEIQGGKPFKAPIEHG